MGVFGSVLWFITSGKSQENILIVMLKFKIKKNICVPLQHVLYIQTLKGKSL